MRQYPKINLKNAKALRQEMTPWEQKLWYYLRGGRFLGIKFKRQVPFGSYILDFYSAENKLGIELDGGQHNQAMQSEYDKQRDQFLLIKASKYYEFGIMT